MADHNTVDARRKRINLYKRIIVIIIISLILLPTLLCIILFFRINALQKEIKEIKLQVRATQVESDYDISSNSAQNIHPTEPVDYQENTGISNASGSGSPVEFTTEDSTTESSADVTKEVVSETTVVVEPTISEQELVAQALSEGRKVVYLTFDDGPCANTENLLAVLKEYDVKVTFFVNYHEGYENEYARILEEGHSLATHTNTHVYSSVYGNLDSFIYEVESLRGYLKDSLNYDANLFRFPGGSSNSMTRIPIGTFISYLNEQNIIYYDWNVSSGDGGGYISAEAVYNNVINGVNKNDVSIVLMHDSTDKMTTFEAIDDIIRTLQDMNALILPITEDTVPVHHHTN